MTELESKCLYTIIRSYLDITTHNVFPPPINLKSLYTGAIKSHFKKAVSELCKKELVYLTYYGGKDEDGQPFCVWGYKPTEKAKETEEYKKAVAGTKCWERKDI